MSGKRYLLDTGAIIALFKKRPEVKFIIEEDTSSFFIPITTVGELYYGAFKSNNPKKHIQLIEAITKELDVLKVEIEVSKTYGKIKTDLQKKGTPIPENDIWIAAIALSYDLDLINSDKHYDYIDNLKQVKF